MSGAAPYLHFNIRPRRYRLVREDTVELGTPGQAQMNDTSRRSANESTAPMCPHCGTERGVPTGIMVGDGKQTITYRCPGCAQTWQVSTAQGPFKPLT